MHLACIPPCLSPIADFLRKGSTLSPGKWRIYESAIGIENVARFVGGKLPHSRARNLDVDHGLSPSRCNIRNRIKRYVATARFLTA